MQESTKKQLLESLYRKLATFEALYLTQKIIFFRPNPQSPGQQQFFRDQNASIRLVLGDNRSGKSVCGIVEAIAHSLGYRPWLPADDPDYIVKLPGNRPIPVPNVGRIIVEDFTQHVTQNLLSKIREWAPRGYYKLHKNSQGAVDRVDWSNGSIWHIMTDNMDDDAFEATSGHWFWGDEPFGYKKYVGLRRGLVDKGGHCWMTLTPLKQPWIADIIEERANDPDGKVKAYEFSIWENLAERGGYLDRQYIENWIDDLTEDEKAARLGRQWAHLTGRVFKAWKPRPPYWIKPFDIPVSWPRVCVIDPHPNKPIAVMWAAVNPDNQWYVYRELWDDGLTTVAEVAERIKELEGHEPVALRVIDSSSKERERTSGESIMQRFAACGIYCLAAPKRNADAGFDAIREALKVKHEWGEPMLAVFNTCPTVKQNFMRFVWDDWKSSRDKDIKGPKQTFVKNNDDFIAAIRYIFQSHLTWSLLTRELQQKEEQLDRERMRGVNGINMRTGEIIGRYPHSRAAGPVSSY